MSKKITHWLLSVYKRIYLLTVHPALRIVVLLPPIIVVIQLVLIGISYRNLPPLIPLFYSRPWGEEQLINPLALYILPIGIVFWYLLAIILIHKKMSDYRVFSQLLLVIQAVSGLGGLYVLLRILFLVT